LHFSDNFFFSTFDHFNLIFRFSIHQRCNASKVGLGAYALLGLSGPRRSVALDVMLSATLAGLVAFFVHDTEFLAMDGMKAADSVENWWKEVSK
jgi:hypothetical protein